MTFKLISFLCTFVLLSSVTGQKCKKSYSTTVGKSNSEPYKDTEGQDTPCACGIIQNSGKEVLLVGGTPVPESYKYPWMVSLRKSWNHACGGSLISRSVVLTAAHCFLRKGEIVDDPSTFEIGIRGKETSTVNKTFGIQRVIAHPEYEISSFMNDVALIQLKRPIACSDYLRPICLPSNVPVPRAGTKVTILGWGRTHNKTVEGPVTSPILMEASLKIQKEDVCKSHNPGRNTHICAQGDSSSTCTGDSGGPLFGEVNRTFYIFGLTSYGTNLECDPGAPQYYSNVKEALGWIQTTIKNEIE